MLAKRIFLASGLLLCAALFLCSCSSTKDGKKEEVAKPPQEENPALRKAREEWKKFVAEREAEERRRHDMTSMQNDNMKVFPWRSGSGRRSEQLHEQSDNSVFKLW